MRSEQEMYDLILHYANTHEDIRAVILNGSRANPKRIVDPFNDFDIVYLVHDLSVYKNKAIHHDFGELLIYQRTDISELFAENYPDFVCYLMQFKDGNRIDLTIADISHFHRYCYEDRLSVVLLDKDGVIGRLLQPDERSHYIQKPSERMFQECRTEFFWTAPYVAKGLWRNQLLYAQEHMEKCIRKMLLQMLFWYCGTLSGFDQSLGKCGDRMAALLPKRIWETYLRTYALCHKEDIWQALETACALFTEISKDTACALNFSIDDGYDTDIPAYLNYVKTLPCDAKTLDLSEVFDK